MTGGAREKQSGRLLLITGRRWVVTSRLALAARNAGFSVYLLAPKGHPLEALPWVHPFARFSTVRPGRCVARAMKRMAFDLVVAADDVAAAAVFDAYLSGRLDQDSGLTIRRSFGEPGTFAIRHSRAGIGEIVVRAGIPAPRTWLVPDEESLVPVLRLAGFPAVLKSDGTFGGRGVTVVRDAGEARDAYRRLASPPRLMRGLIDLLRESDTYNLNRSLLRKRRLVSIQEFVDGEPATVSAVAWEGTVLGQVGFRVIRTRTPNGPSSVIEPMQHGDMARAATAVASELGLSGPFGLDFIVSRDGSTASLLELNPRATSTTHLQVPWQGRPLFHLLADQVGLHAPDHSSPLSAGLIALFPPDTGSDDDDANPLDVHVDVPDDQGVLDGYLWTSETPIVRGIRRLRSLSTIGRSD
jgi:hypothetical protein